LNQANVIDDNDVYDYTQANANLFGGEAGIHFHPHPRLVAYFK
jgi:iron complex outermembrane receptor protein